MCGTNTKTDCDTYVSCGVFLEVIEVLEEVGALMEVRAVRVHQTEDLSIKTSDLSLAHKG